MNNRSLMLGIGAMSLLAAVTVFSSGCRFGTPEDTPLQSAVMMEKTQKMSLDDAKKIVDTMLSNPPAGRIPLNPGYEFLAQNVTRMRSRQHIRTHYYLVEVFSGKNVILKFYVVSEADAQKFAAALRRLQQEYKK